MTSRRKLETFDSGKHRGFSLRGQRDHYTPEERAFTLELLREARQACDPHYARNAAGFWLDQQAPHELRESV